MILRNNSLRKGWSDRVLLICPLIRYLQNRRRGLPHNSSTSFKRHAHVKPCNSSANRTGVIPSFPDSVGCSNAKQVTYSKECLARILRFSIKFFDTVGHCCGLATQSYVANVSSTVATVGKIFWRNGLGVLGCMHKCRSSSDDTGCIEGYNINCKSRTEACKLEEIDLSGSRPFSGEAAGLRQAG